MSNKFQNEDFKSEAELVAAGGTKAQLLNDTKVYVSANGIAKTLDQAIADGDIGAGGDSDSDALLIQNFDAASLGQFTQTGLAFETTSPLNGNKSAKLTHQAAVNQSFKQTVAVPLKFRGQIMSVAVVAKSAATVGNVTILFRDETNNIDIQASQQIQADSTIRSFQYGVKIPSNCTSFSYTITALPESGSPVTYIDDIVIRNYWIGTSVQGQTEYQFEVPVIGNDTSFTPVSNLTNVTAVGSYRRVGEYAEINYSFTFIGTPAVVASIDIDLPAGINIDSNKLLGVTNLQTSLAVYRDTSVAPMPIAIRVVDANTFRIRTLDDATGSIIESGNLGTSGIVSGDYIEISIKVPISGWSATELKKVVVNDLVSAKSMNGSASIEVPVVSETLSYVPALTSTGGGAITLNATSKIDSNGKYHREGKYLVGEVSFRNGSGGAATGAAGSLLIGLPSGLSIDTSLLPTNVAGISSQGFGAAGGSPDKTLMVLPYNTTTIRLYRPGDVAYVAVADITAGYFVTINFKLPIVEWTATETKTWSSTQMLVEQESDGHLQINGFLPAKGSTNTTILTLSSPTYNVMDGDHITYSQSAVAGDSFTATKDGIYSFNLSFYQGSVSNVVGFSKNATQLTTDIRSINVSDRLTMEIGSGSSDIIHVSWTGKLKIGDVIRIHGESSAFTSPNATYSSFSCSYQGSVKAVQTSSDQKMEIPTHELRFEGASAVGSTATKIVRFDALAKIKGDAFTVINTAADGTYVQFKKAGKLDVSASLYFASGVSQVAITKNQATLTSSSPSNSETLAGSYGNSVGNVSSASWSGNISVGDIIRVCSASAPSANVFNSFNFLFQEQSVAVSVSNTLPQYSESDSMVRVGTTNGYGSTATKIKRFSNILENIGKDVVFSDSATNGSSFTIMSDGIYHITYYDVMSLGSEYFGITKNASSLTTNISSLTNAEVLSLTRSSSGSTNDFDCVSWSGFLTAGTIIRAHTDGGASPNSAGSLTISKSGKPNVTGVDVTPFIELPRPVITDWKNYVPSLTGSTSNPAIGNGSIIGRWRRIGDSIECAIEVQFGSTSTFGSGQYLFNLPNGLKIDHAKLTFLSTNAILGIASMYDDSAGNVLTGVPNIPNTDVIGIRVMNSTTHHTNVTNTVPWTWATNDRINFNFRLPIVGWTAEEDSILTEPEIFSTDTANLQYASSSQYTLSTLKDAPVGTFITFTHAINTNNRTQTTTAPTQSISDMNSNGIQITGRAYNAASVAGSPSEIAIQIGKNHKGFKVQGFNGTLKTNAFANEYFIVSSATEVGSVVTYNPLTGILTIEAAIAWYASNTSRSVGVLNGGGYSSGYFVINASKNPALTGLNTNDFVGVRCTTDAGQAIVTGGTTLTFEDVIVDTHGFMSGSSCIIRKSGKYDLFARYLTNTLTPGATTNAVQCQIFKNGVAISKALAICGSTSASVYPSGIAMAKNYPLVEGDIITVVAIPPVNTNVYADGLYNEFSIERKGN